VKEGHLAKSLRTKWFNSTIPANQKRIFAGNNNYTLPFSTDGLAVSIKQVHLRKLPTDLPKKMS
jgi:hypothetical protein